MSIDDLMNAVRTGEFEKNFQVCESAEQKIELFKEYGIVISLEQYKNIETKVRSIKEGTGEAYDALEKEVECKPEDIPETELQKISAGVRGITTTEEKAVMKVLELYLSVSDGQASAEPGDEDMKVFPTHTPGFPNLM